MNLSFKTDCIPIFRPKTVEVTELESDLRLFSVPKLCKMVSQVFVFLDSVLSLTTVLCPAFLGESNVFQDVYWPGQSLSQFLGENVTRLRSGWS